MPDGQPTGAQIQTYTDALAKPLKFAYGLLGLGAPGETGTLAATARMTRGLILGDGVSSFGLGAPSWQGQVAGGLAGLVSAFRYDTLFARNMQPFVTLLDNQVKSYLPTGWLYRATGAQAHAFDMHLTRLNALAPNTPTAPTLNGSLTAISDPAGTLPNCATANAPRVVWTWVGANDYNESLPAPECPQTAITGGQNGYLLTLPGSVPTGVAKARIYRTYVGGAAGLYYWDQDVAATPGAAAPVVKIVDNDASLRVDVNPPAWMSALVTPEFAALFALAYATTLTTGASAGFGLASVSNANGLQLNAQNMLSPTGVLAGPATGFCGIGNTPGSVLFGSSLISGANAQTYSPNTLQAVNNAAQNIQGYAGSTGFQARVTSPLNGSCTPTVQYSYLNAANGQTLMTGALIGTALASAAGSVSNFAVPSGQLVVAATVTGVSGTATTGAFVIEPTIRAY